MNVNTCLLRCVRTFLCSHTYITLSYQSYRPSIRRRLQLYSIKMMPSYHTSVSVADSPYHVVDLRSDTVSKPTLEMRQAMFDAEVGDDVYNEDPTVRKLEKLAADMFNKEAAIFLTSGTMGNLVAIMAHCDKRGCELICGDQSHTFLYEQGGPAQVAAVHTRILPNLPDGTFDLGLAEKAIRGDDIHLPVTSLICVENTHNMCGGKVLPLEWLDKVGALAKKYNIPLHMDGARVFNAATHLGVPVSRITEHCDSIQICLSKGLGCPLGSLLIGTKQLIAKALRLRKLLGGGMRQVGVVAAPGIIALEKMTTRLADDHKRTTAIAQAIEDAKCDFIKVDLQGLHTNILMVHLNTKVITSPELCSKLASVDDKELKEVKDDAVVVRVSPKSLDVVRIVVCYDVTDEDIRKVIRKLLYIIQDIIKTSK